MHSKAALLMMNLMSRGRLHFFSMRLYLVDDFKIPREHHHSSIKKYNSIDQYSKDKTLDCCPVPSHFAIRSVTY